MLLPDAPDTRPLAAQLAPVVERLARLYARDAGQQTELANRLYQYLSTFTDQPAPQGSIPLRPYLLRQLTLLASTPLTGTAAPDEQSLPSPETPAVSSEPPAMPFLRGLPDAIASLPDQQRQIVLWRYYDGLTCQEIAARLSLAPAEVDLLLKTTLQILRCLLRPGAASER